jgi:2-phosphosulfolactate phosphatase
MGKLHLLMKKEDVDAELIKDKIAIVFDVLLATSTIAVCLHSGAKEVIPVLNENEARQEAIKHKKEDILLVGEYEGRTIEGFLDPNPLGLREKVAGKSVILSTTNGTVAIRKASEAKKIYTASLLNGLAVAEQVNVEHSQETIIIICSGSSNTFCLEDLFGAGYFLHCLLQETQEEWDLTDAAQAALHFYQGNSENNESLLLESRVGQMISKAGFAQEVHHVAQRGVLATVPCLKGNKLISEN